jgi:hypothetical protein
MDLYCWNSGIYHLPLELGRLLLELQVTEVGVGDLLVVATGDLTFGDKISLTPGDFTVIVTTGDMNFFEDFFFCFAADSSCFSTCFNQDKILMLFIRNRVTMAMNRVTCLHNSKI